MRTTVGGTETTFVDLIWHNNFFFWKKNELPKRTAKNDDSYITDIFWHPKLKAKLQNWISKKGFLFYFWRNFDYKSVDKIQICFSEIPNFWGNAKFVGFLENRVFRGNPISEKKFFWEKLFARNFFSITKCLFFDNKILYCLLFLWNFDKFHENIFLVKIRYSIYVRNLKFYWSFGLLKEIIICWVLIRPNRVRPI